LSGAAEDDFTWARLAATMTVRQLKDRLTASGLKPLSARVGDAEEDATMFEFKASPELQAKWQFGMELANRLWEREVGPAGFLDTCVMEATSEHPLSCIRSLTRPGNSLLTAGRMNWPSCGRRERHLERETCNWSSLAWEVDDPVVPDLTLPDGADVFAMDEKLRAARCFLQEVTGMLMRLPGGAAGATTGTPEVCPSRSSRTRDRSSQHSYTHADRAKLSHDVLKPSSSTTLIGNSRTLGTSPAPGCDEPTSSAKTAPSLWTLGRYQPVTLEYLLFVERCPFHEETPDHYDRLSSLLDLLVSQSGKLVPLHSTADFRPA